MSWSQIINRNIGQTPIRGLFESTPVERVQNVEFYTLLLNDLKSVASPWESYPLGANVFQLLPADPGLYMFVWGPAALTFSTDKDPLCFQKILYIGKASVSLKDRFRSEYRRIIETADPSLFWHDTPAETRQARLQRLLSLEPIDLWFCRIPSTKVDLIDNLETRLIELINPPGNFQRKLKPIGAPQPIWRT
jgi:hypothetical protein